MPMEGSKSLPLTGRTALVTGAAAGIGRATAIELARHGADIAICDIAPLAAGAEIVSLVANLGRHAFYYQGDVGDRKRMMHVFKQMKRDLGRLDILVNNSGLNIR